MRCRIFGLKLYRGVLDLVITKLGLDFLKIARWGADLVVHPNLYPTLGVSMGVYCSIWELRVASGPR